MSRRNRQRRSAAELLDTSRGILFPDEDLSPIPIQDGQLDQVSYSNPDQDLQADLDQDLPADLDQNLETHPDEPDGNSDGHHTDQPTIRMEQLDQLTALTQALQLAGRPSFKPPTFSGKEDVELFLRQFADVADANRWTPLERTLHLRSQLQGDAQGCGQGETYQDIVEDLQARYGLTRRGARDRLSNIRLKSSQNVHKQASEISKLVAIAFPVLPNTDQQTMALEYFSRAWESKAVQEHLLSRGPTTMREAVRATEEFLAIHESGPRPRAHTVEQTQEDSEAERQATQAGFLMMAEAMKTQTALLQQLIVRLDTPPPTPTPVRCYDCGGPHYRKDCPARHPAGNQHRQTGNGIDPARV